MHSVTVTTLHLIRHASYALLGNTLAGRSGDYALTAQGRAEAAALAATVFAGPTAEIVASPLRRARETAAPIAARAGLNVTIDPDLNEVDFGDWTGSTFATLHHRPDWQAFNRLRSLHAPPGGESMLAVQQRGIAAIMRICARCPDGAVAVVSHGDVIKAILAHLLGVPLDLFQRIEIAPASRSVVRIFPMDVRIDAINLPPFATQMRPHPTA